MKHRELFLLFCLLLLLIFSSVKVHALETCKYCNFTVEKEEKVCPKCLRKLKWPFSPQRTYQGAVVVRDGKDAFIRHPQAQNRHWLSNRNAGSDTYGPIGSWGNPTGLRYLINFNIPKAFLEAKKDLMNFSLSKAKLIIRTANDRHKQNIPIIVFPLTTPFEEGSCRLSSRKSQASGCTWELSSSFLTWANEGGDYSTTTYATGYLSSENKDNVIDVTSIINKRINEYKQTGKWNNPGMIIMRNQSVFSNCKFLDILSFDAGREKNVTHVVSPELYLED